MSARRKKDRRKAPSPPAINTQPAGGEPAARPRENSPSPPVPRRARLATWKKTLFALVAVAIFFGIVEWLLAIVGVRPVLYDEDPYVGFAGYIPLFVENHQKDGQIYLATARNKLHWFNYQEFPKAKPQGAYRIFCMGGSTT